MRILVIIFLFTAISLRAQKQAEIYINKYDSLAVEVMNTYGIPASLVLGIALLESGSGTSKLCLRQHNHFGVKGGVKPSKTKSGYTSAYRSFQSDEAAYLHFGRMVSAKKYYPGLRGNMEYMKWLRAMKAANYATAPNWVSYVDKIIKRYHLTEFDKTVPFPFLPAPVTTDSLNRWEMKLP